MPDIIERFTIDQPPATVWAFLQDIPRVVTCVPGVSLTEQSGPASYRGKLRIKLGPVTGAFEGEATVTETDAASRRAHIKGQGHDRQGGSRAQAAISYRVEPASGGAEVIVEADIKLSGAMAQIGRTGIVKDVAAELTAEFARNLRAALASAAPVAAAVPQASAASLGAGHLIWRVIARRLCALAGPLLRALGLARA
jgi:carbon monoxide dehydrogenase subunit G